MASRNSAVWHEAQASAVLKHWDEEEDGHWDASPASQERFSHKGGTDVYTQHLRTSSRKIKTRRGTGSSVSSHPDSPTAKVYGASFRSSVTRGSSDAGVRESVSSKPKAPRCASAKTRTVVYDFTPGPGAYSPTADRKGASTHPGGGTMAWTVNKEGSRNKVGRGTTINVLASHKHLKGVTPFNPEHQNITAERAGSGQQVHIGYMSPGPIYMARAEKTSQSALFGKEERITYRRTHVVPVGTYTPTSVRDGTPVTFSNDKTKRGKHQFSKAPRPEANVYISTGHEKLLLGKDSLGPAHYDYLRLDSVYSADKTTAFQPKDGTLSRSSPSPTINPRGITLLEAVETRGRSLPGPFEYKKEQTTAQYPDRTGAKFGTAAKSQIPIAGWNPTCSKHVAERPGFTPLYLSKGHAASLAGSFSPGPALYSPGGADSGRMASDKGGAVFGTGHRFTPSGSAAAVITSLPSTMLRRAGEPSREAADDTLSSEGSDKSVPMSSVDWGGLPVGRQPVGRRSMAARRVVASGSGRQTARGSNLNHQSGVNRMPRAGVSTTRSSPRTEVPDYDDHYSEEEEVEDVDSDDYDDDEFEEEEEEE